MTEFLFFESILLNKTEIASKPSLPHAGWYQTRWALVRHKSSLHRLSQWCWSWADDPAVCYWKRTEHTLHTMCLSLHATSHLAPFCPFPHSFHLSLSPLTPRRLLRSAFLRSPLGDYTPLAYASTERGSVSLQLSRPLISFPSLTFILRFPLPSSPILLVRASWAGCNVSVLPSRPLAVLTALAPANKQEQEGFLRRGQTVHSEGAHPSHPVHLPHASSLLSAWLFLSQLCFSHERATHFLTSIWWFLDQKESKFLSCDWVCVSDCVPLKVWEWGEKLKIHVHVWENSNFIKSLHGVWTCLTGAHSAAH